MAEKATDKKTATKKAPAKKAAPKAEKKTETAKKPAAKKAAPKKTADKVAGFGVIETGSKQYKVQVGDVITIEKLSDEMNDGDKVIFDKVVLLDDGKTTTLGTPYVSGAQIQGVLEWQGKGQKITVQRFRSKSRYHRRYGHRQPQMKVKITSLK